MNTTKWDMADHIKTAEDAAVYLQAAIEEDDTELFLAVLGDIARSEGMNGLAKRLGVSRESLYRSLSQNGNPSFATVMKVFHILGFQISIRQKQAS